MERRAGVCLQGRRCSRGGSIRRGAHLTAVHFAHSVLRVAHVLILHEGEARRLARDPHAPQRAVAVELQGRGWQLQEADIGLCRSLSQGCPREGLRYVADLVTPTAR